MPKSKNTRKNKVSKLDADQLSHDFFESMMEDAAIGHIMSPGDDSSIGQMVSSVITTSIQLSKIVIENRTFNSEKMNDDDIYDIYKKSFKTIVETTSSAQDE